MENFNKFIIPILAIAFMTLTQACSDDPASPGSDTSEAEIHGSVTESTSDESSQLQSSLTNVEGITVAAARITSDGSFETIAGTETQTDASGQFTLHVDTETTQHIAIIAESGGDQVMGFLSGKVENDHTYTIKPLNTESTAETEIFAALVASGEIENVKKSDIETIVSGSNAVHLHENTAAIAAFASGLSTAAEARAVFIAEIAEENAEAIAEQAAELSADAQFQLEASLESATSAEERDSAYELYMESVADAYVEAGLDAASAAKSFEVWSRTLFTSTAELTSEILNDTRKTAYAMTAIAVDKAVQTEAQLSGMSESTIQTIADAGVQLMSEISSSGGAETEITAAFDQYHEDVRSAMENDGSFEATAIVYIDADINASGGYKALFNTAISGTLSSSLIIDAYTAFFSSIHSSVENHLEEADEAQIEAVTNMMILINLTS
jgi:hypothetical protein